MTSGATFYGLILIILCGHPDLFSFTVNGANFCSVGNDCTCSRGSDGTYEVDCSRTVLTTEASYEHMYEMSSSKSHVLLVKVKPGSYALIQCNPSTEWGDMSLVSGLKLQSCPVIKFLYCPLPDSSRKISSFRTFLNSIGVENVTTISFQSYKTLGDGLKAEHLMNLTGVTKLTLTDNGLTLLPEDLFSGVPDLSWIELRGNKIKVPALLFQGLSSLESIELGNNEISSLPTKLFHGLSNLTHLNLWSNKLVLANVSRSHFKDLILLESLDLSSNALATLNEDIFYDLVSLRILNLNSNNFSSLPRNLFVNNKNLETLRLNGNNAPMLTLSNGLLSNLTSLMSVLLDRCGIESLPGDLFRGSTSLKSLSLLTNRLKSLPGDLFVGLINLEKLNLNGNQLIDLSELPFKKLNSLVSLQLGYNNLTILPSALFNDLRSLEELDLKSNKLKSLAQEAFAQNRRLRKVNLSDNELTFVESLVDEYGKTSPFESCVNMEILDLANNAVEDICSDWKLVMLNLRELNLSQNAVSELSFNDLHFLSGKLTVDLRYNKISVIDFEQAVSLTQEQPNLSAGRSVKVLVDNNPIKCDCNVYHLLKYFEERTPPQVKHLVDLQVNDLWCSNSSYLAGKRLKDLNSHTLTCDLGLPKFSMDEDEALYKDFASDNRTETIEYINEKCPSPCQCLWRPEDDGLIVDCREGNLSRFPYALPVTRRTSYVELWASGLGLVKLWPSSSLCLGYDKIRVLQLSKNALSSINASSIPPHLKVLDLHQNNLTHLNKSVLDAISNISEISLHSNPWLCDCDARYLLEFIQEKFKQVKFLPNVTCMGGYVTNKPLSHLTLNELCPIHNVIAAACITVALFGLVVGTLAALYYRHQQEIKIWLYAHNLFLWFVTEDELDRDKEYDAFISYSHQDEDFVVGELVPVLEGGMFPDKGHAGDVKYSMNERKKDSMKYKLCLHYRDWVAGEWIPAQIARSVDSSRRTIVVLSPAFLESVWGQMEFRAAHCRALSEGRSRVIVILYGDVPPADHLDPELRTYLTTNTYVKWGEPWFWHKLRYALPHMQNKKRKKVPATLTARTDLNGKHWENGNGQCKPLELIHTNPAAEAEIKKR